MVDNKYIINVSVLLRPFCILQITYLYLIIPTPLEAQIEFLTSKSSLFFFIPSFLVLTQLTFRVKRWREGGWVSGRASFARMRNVDLVGRVGVGLVGSGFKDK